MGVLEDVILNAKVVLNNVGKKAGDLVDISKLRISAAEINHEIENQYREIGRCVYQAAKDEVDNAETIDELIQGIDELAEQLELGDDKIKELKNENLCAACGAALPKNAQFCCKCGAKVGE